MATSTIKHKNTPQTFYLLLRDGRSISCVGTAHQITKIKAMVCERTDNTPINVPCTLTEDGNSPNMRLVVMPSDVIGVVYYVQPIEEEV